MTVNEGLIKAAGNMILAFPESWDQKQWCKVNGESESTNACGTTYCMAGWVGRITGYLKSDGQLTKKGRLFSREGGYEEDYNANAGMSNYGWIHLGAKELGLSYDVAEELFMIGGATFRRQADTPEAMMDAIFEYTGVRVNPPLADNFDQNSTLNVPFLRAIVGMIEAHPENYNQGTWASSASEKAAKSTLCGTTFCLAGWATTLAGATKLDGSLSKPFKAIAKNAIRKAHEDKTGKIQLANTWIDGFWVGDLEYTLQADQSLKNDPDYKDDPDYSPGDAFPGVFWTKIASNLLGLRDDTHIFSGAYGDDTVEGLKRALTADFGVTF